MAPKYAIHIHHVGHSHQQTMYSCVSTDPDCSSFCNCNTSGGDTKIIYCTLTFTPDTGQYDMALATRMGTGTDGHTYQGSAYGNVLGTGAVLTMVLSGGSGVPPIVCFLSADINHIPITYRVESDFFQAMDDKFLTLS